MITLQYLFFLLDQSIGFRSMKFITPNWGFIFEQVGLAAFDLRSASLHLSQYIETSGSYPNTKTLLHFYDPIVIIMPPNKSAPNSAAAVTELVDKFYGSVKKVM